MRNSTAIFGPPGTGKSTKVLSFLNDFLDSGISHHHIGLVSFTKAAAQELAKRAGIDPGGNIATIHSMAFRLADLTRDQVVSNSDLREFGNRIKIPITGSNPEEGEFAEVGDAYLALHAKLRSQLSYDLDNLDELKKGFIEARIDGSMWQFEYFCKAYDEYKSNMGLVDFTDMLTLALKCRNPGFKVLFVDEAQDLSPLQWELIYKWSETIDDIIIAGDDDQSIYVWGGADPHGMAKFVRDFNSEVIILDQSYRVPVQVHELANSIISNITGDRVDKAYKPTEHGGILQYHSSVWTLKDQIKPDADMLILYRNHSLREDIEEFMMSRGIPYMVQSGKPGALQSMYARAAMLWERISKEWRDHSAIITSPHLLKPLITLAKPTLKRRIKEEDLTGLAKYHWSKIINIPGPKAIYLRRLEDNYGKLSDIKVTVRLSTIHGSKGQEADHVILVNGMTERTYESMSLDPDSEIRTFYVGATRARLRLDIVMSKNPVTFMRV